MEDIKITGQVGGKVNDEELELRFKTLLRQMKEGRGLFTFSEQLKAILDEVDKSSLASEMSYGSQLTELNQLSARISEIFVGIAKQNETDRIFQERQHDEIINNKDGVITKLKEQLNELKTEFEQKTLDFAGIEEDNHKLTEDIITLKGRVDDQIKMIEFLGEQLKEKDQTIANQVKRIESMSQAVSENEELKLSVVHLQEEIVNIQEKHEKEKGYQVFDFERQLFAKEKELQALSQERIEKIRDDMNDKYEERLVSIIDKHDNRVAVLNKEISTLKGEYQQKSQNEENLLKEVQNLKEQAEDGAAREKKSLNEIDRLTQIIEGNSK